MSILIYTYHIAIDTVSICIYVYVYLYILSGKICYIFLILTEILKRNPSTPTTGERKVVGQFQVFVGSQFDAGNIAMSWTSPIFLADTSPRIVRVLPCVYQVVTFFSHCFPHCFPRGYDGLLPSFYHGFPGGFPWWPPGQDSKWTSWRTILVNQKAQELLGSGKLRWSSLEWWCLTVFSGVRW